MRGEGEEVALYDQYYPSLDFLFRIGLVVSYAVIQSILSVLTGVSSRQKYEG
jgi:hypothetical protein